MMIAVNESADFETPGDVTVYVDVNALSEHLEVIDVVNGEFFAIGETGQVFNVASDGMIISLEEVASGDLNVETLRHWLGLSASEDIVAHMRGMAVHSFDPSSKHYSTGFWVVVFAAMFAAYYFMVTKYCVRFAE